MATGERIRLGLDDLICESCHVLVSKPHLSHQCDIGVGSKRTLTAMVCTNRVWDIYLSLTHTTGWSNPDNVGCAFFIDRLFLPQRQCFYWRLAYTGLFTILLTVCVGK